MPLDMSGQELSDTFAAAWGVAKRHLQGMGHPDFAWVRADLHEPLIVHLSFRLGNQLFFVFVDVDGGLLWQGHLQGLLFDASTAAGAHACRFPVTDDSTGDATLRPAESGWGLVDASSGRRIEPPALATATLIELSDWEIHDLAVRVVCDRLRRGGAFVETWQSYRGVYPTVWFTRAGDVGWVAVAVDRWPAHAAARPKDLSDMKARFPGAGHFASVIVAADGQNIEAADPVPIYRGHAIRVSCADLEPL